MPPSLFGELKPIETILRVYECGTVWMLSSLCQDISSFEYVCITRTLLAMYLHSAGTVHLFLDKSPCHNHGSDEETSNRPEAQRPS